MLNSGPSRAPSQNTSYTAAAHPLMPSRSHPTLCFSKRDCFPARGCLGFPFAGKNWERAKLGLKSVDADCQIDLSELSTSMLDVTMGAMDNGRRQKNQGGDVRRLRTTYGIVKSSRLWCPLPGKRLSRGYCWNSVE